MKIITVYGNVYIVLFSKKKENNMIEDVSVFTDIYAAERFCRKVDGKMFIKAMDSENVLYGRDGAKR